MLATSKNLTSFQLKAPSSCGPWGTCLRCLMVSLPLVLIAFLCVVFLKQMKMDGWMDGWIMISYNAGLSVYKCPFDYCTVESNLKESIFFTHQIDLLLYRDVNIDRSNVAVIRRTKQVFNHNQSIIQSIKTHLHRAVCRPIVTSQSESESRIPAFSAHGTNRLLCLYRYRKQLPEH